MVCIGIPTLRPLSELPRFTGDRKPISPALPAHKRTDSNVSRPAAAYTKGRCDSVDEIISEYENQHAGVIWVRNEVRVQEDVANWPLRS